MPSTRVSFHHVTSADELAQMTEMLAAAAFSSSTPDNTVLSEIPSAFVALSATGATYRNEPVSRYNPISQLFFATVGLIMPPNSNDNDNDYYYNSFYDVTYFSVDVGAVLADYHPNSSEEPDYDNHPMTPLVQLLRDGRIVKVVHDGRGLVDALAHNRVPDYPNVALFPDCVLIGPCLDTSLLPLLLGNSTAVMTTLVCRDGTPLSELRRKNSNDRGRHRRRNHRRESEEIEPQLVHQHHYLDPYLPRALRGVCKLPSLADTLNYYYLLQPVQNPYAAVQRYYGTGGSSGEEERTFSNAMQATDAFANSPYASFCHCTNVWSIGMSALAHARRLRPDLVVSALFTPQLCGTLLALLGVAVSQFHPESLCLSYGFDNVVIRNKQTLRRYNQQDGEDNGEFGPHGSHHYHRGGHRRRDVVVALAPETSLLPDTVKADIARRAAQEVFDATSRFHNIMAFYVYKGGSAPTEKEAAACHFRELLAHSRGGNYLPFGVLQPLPPAPTQEQLRAADAAVESSKAAATEEQPNLNTNEEETATAVEASQVKTRKERRKRKQKLADFQESSGGEMCSDQVLLYDVHVCHQCGLPFSTLHIPAKIARARQHALSTGDTSNTTSYTCANCVERSLPCEFYRRGCCHHIVGGEAEGDAVPTNIRRCDYKHILLPCPFGNQCIKAHAEALQCRGTPAFIGAGSCPYTHSLTTDVKNCVAQERPEPLSTSLVGDAATIASTSTTVNTTAATAATAAANSSSDTAAATTVSTWSQEIKPVIENRRSIAETLRQHQLEAAERRTQRTQQNRPSPAAVRSSNSNSTNTHTTKVSPSALVTAVAATGRPQPRMTRTPCPRYFYTVLGCPLSEAECPYSHTPVPVYVPVPVLIKRQGEPP